MDLSGSRNRRDFFFFFGWLREGGNGDRCDQAWGGRIEGREHWKRWLELGNIWGVMQKPSAGNSWNLQE